MIRLYEKYFRLVSIGLSLFLVGCILEADTHVYIGGYTRDGGEGIYRTTLNPDTGALSEAILAARVEDASFLALHPREDFLYAVSELRSFRGRPEGAVSGFSIAEDGSLSLLDQVGSGGTISCHLCFEPEGKVLMVANYGSGSVASYSMSEDGRIGAIASLHQHEGVSIVPRHRQAPHAHSVIVDPAGIRAFLPELRLGKIYIYEIEKATGTLVLNDPPFLKVPGESGPRHLSFHPSGAFAYVNYELTMEVAALRHDRKTGGLEIIDVVPTVQNHEPGPRDSTAEILVHPTGRWLYVSNRGPNSVSVFQIEQQRGTLRFLESESTQGVEPRGFGIDPSGKFLVVGNRRSNSVVVLRIDQETGELEPTGSIIEVPEPANVRFWEN